MQQYKNTIAILGAVQPAGKQIATGTCEQYNLLLVDDNSKELELLQQQVYTQNPGAHAEIVACAGNASWEADIIVITAHTPDLLSLAKKIEAFSTRKTVVQVKMGNERTASLDKLLPHAKLAVVQIEKEIALINGADEEALMTAAMLMDLCGLLPVCKHQSTKTI